MKYWDLKDKKLIAGRLVERSVFPKIINIFREIKGMALGALYALRPAVGVGTGDGGDGFVAVARCSLSGGWWSGRDPHSWHFPSPPHRGTEGDREMAEEQPESHYCVCAHQLDCKGLPWWLSGEEFTCQCRKTQIRSLIQEDSTSCGATEPTSHNYWTCALKPRGTATEPACCCNWSPRALDPVLQSKTGHHDEKSTHHN